MIAWARPPGVTRIAQALYNPHLARAFCAFCEMRRDGSGQGLEWASDAEQCLDRTEIVI